MMCVGGKVAKHLKKFRSKRSVHIGTTIECHLIQHMGAVYCGRVFLI